MNIINKYKETLDRLEIVRQEVNENSELISKLNDEREYEYKAKTYLALPIATTCLGIMGGIFAVGLTPLVAIAAGVTYLGDYLENRRKNK